MLEPLPSDRSPASTSSVSGIANVFHAGKWGAVCASPPTLPVAQVVCRQLGFSSGFFSVTTWLPQAQRAGKITTWWWHHQPVWLDQVTCLGSEKHIVDCHAGLQPGFPTEIKSTGPSGLCSGGYYLAVINCSSGVPTSTTQCTVDNGGCSPYASCAGSGLNRTCACLTGYSGDGKSCIRVCDPQFSASCSDDAHCTNTPLGPTCTCNSGYAGTGRTCNKLWPSWSSCAKYANCIPENQMVECICKNGFFGDGADECSPFCPTLNNPQPLFPHGGCHTDASCFNVSGTQGGYVVSRDCVCNMGYTSDGFDCKPLPTNVADGSIELTEL
jgi:hypothetical protein